MWAPEGSPGYGVGRRFEKRHSVMINQMVSSPFRYVPRRGYVSFPAQSPSGRSCSMNSLLFSTEV